MTAVKHEPISTNRIFIVMKNYVVKREHDLL